MVGIIFDIVVIVLAVFFLFYKLVFSRDPSRKIPKHGIVAPADGKIIKILETDKEINMKKGLVGKINTLVSDIAKNCYVIVIMMNIHNVHVQRSPIEGTVKKIKYSKGKFLNAVFGSGSLNALENEKNEITIENKDIKIKVIQIAGILARRIKCYVRENQKLIKGQRIGMIDLGSQVALILPKKVKLLVKKGQRVKAGSTVVAE